MHNPESELQNARILLVDDTPANLDLLCSLLEKEGCRLSIAPNGRVALDVVQKTRPELILLDVVMPGMDGFEVCRRLKEGAGTASVPVIFITAKGLTENVVDGFDVGGVDYITKPFQDKEVLARVRTHLSVGRLNRELSEKNRALEEEIAQRQKLKGRLSQISAREAERWGLEELVGESPTMQQIFKDIRLLRENSTSALVTGESGTGKELIARALHYGSPRREGPFVPVNCGALPRELAESLLFGHLKGAFTGADTDRAGCFEAAYEGTLFLDEIGELPLELQPKLLRVLEDGRVQRLGSHQAQPVDVRIVAATNVDLPYRINEGAFRSDLYYRLARYTIMAPPLRHRREDIPLLTRHMLAQLAEEMGREVPELTESALDALTAYEFPGNVRQLKNVVERLLIENRGAPVRDKDLYFLASEASPVVENGDEEVPLELDALEQWAIQRALSRTRGNVSEAARVQLPSTQDLVAFEFRGRSMNTPANRMAYRYRLKGHHQDWRLVRTERVEYQDLPRGDYVFEVQAVDHDLNYSEPVQVQLKVHLPYERLGWGGSLFLALGLVALQGGRIVRDRRRLKASNAALEQQTEDLRVARDQADAANHAKSEFLANISHEIRTPMNAILGYAQILGRMSLQDDQHRAVDTIQRSGNHLLA